MTPTVVAPEQEIKSPESKSAGSDSKIPGKLDKDHIYIGTISTTIGILGVLGTLFVWLTSTFFVGDVQIKSNQKIEALEVKAYTRKGNEATYHTPSFQLAPGDYHLAITPEGAATKYADIKVEFNRPCIVPIEVVVKAGALNSAKKKLHWWRFWRKDSGNQ